MKTSTISILLSGGLLLGAAAPGISANTTTGKPGGTTGTAAHKAPASQVKKPAIPAKATPNQAAAKPAAEAAGPSVSKQAAQQANKLFSEGIDFADKKFYTEAIVKFQKAIEMDPTKAGYLNELAVSLLSRAQNDDVEQAVAALRKATTMVPKHTAYWVNLGSALNRDNDVAGAEEAYRKALELSPSDWQAHQNLAVALYSQKKLDEARAEFNAAIANNAPAAYKEIAEKAIKDIDAFVAQKEKEEAEAKAEAAKADGKPSKKDVDVKADLRIKLPAEKREGPAPKDDPTATSPKEMGSGSEPEDEIGGAQDQASAKPVGSGNATTGGALATPTDRSIR